MSGYDELADLRERVAKLTEVNDTQADRLTRTLDVLRDHVRDWGDCDRPTDCRCSHARALRFLELWGSAP